MATETLTTCPVKLMSYTYPMRPDTTSWSLWVETPDGLACDSHPFSPMVERAKKELQAVGLATVVGVMQFTAEEMEPLLREAYMHKHRDVRGRINHNVKTW